MANKPYHSTARSRSVSMIFRNYNPNPVIRRVPPLEVVHALYVRET
jgi:hypothetical protein